MFQRIKTFFTNHLNIIGFYRGLLANPKTRVLTIIISLSYLVSPIDLIPDFIPFVGLIDDGLLIAILVGELLKPTLTK